LQVIGWISKNQINGLGRKLVQDFDTVALQNGIEGQVHEPNYTEDYPNDEGNVGSTFLKSPF
jgi:hypothetical protein